MNRENYSHPFKYELEHLAGEAGFDVHKLDLSKLRHSGKLAQTSELPQELNEREYAQAGYVVTEYAFAPNREKARPNETEAELTDRLGGDEGWNNFKKLKEFFHDLQKELGEYL